MSKCKNCEKYVCSCSVLEGFESCCCCGILECKYDICPKEDKIIDENSITIHEFRVKCEVSEVTFNVVKLIRKVIESCKGEYNYDKYDAHKASITQKRLLELRDEIKSDKQLKNEYAKTDMLNDIKIALKRCKNLYYWSKFYINKDRKALNKTTYMFYKKNYYKYSPNAIGCNKILTQDEKINLLIGMRINKYYKYIND